MSSSEDSVGDVDVAQGSQVKTSNDPVGLQFGPSAQNHLEEKDRLLNACRLSKGCQQRTDFGGGVRVPSAAYSVASPLFYIYRQRLYNSRNTWVPNIFKRNNLDTPRMTATGDYLSE